MVLGDLVNTCNPEAGGEGVVRGKEEGEGGSEFGIRGCKLVHIGWVSNEVLL